MKSWDELRGQWDKLLNKARHTDPLFRANALVSGCIKIDHSLYDALRKARVDGVEAATTLDQRIKLALKSSIIGGRGELDPARLLRNDLVHYADIPTPLAALQALASLARVDIKLNLGNFDNDEIGKWLTLAQKLPVIGPGQPPSTRAQILYTPENVTLLRISARSGEEQDRIVAVLLAAAHLDMALVQKCKTEETTLPLSIVEEFHSSQLLRRYTMACEPPFEWLSSDEEVNRAIRVRGWFAHEFGLSHPAVAKEGLKRELAEVYIERLWGPIDALMRRQTRVQESPQAAPPPQAVLPIDRGPPLPIHAAQPPLPLKSTGNPSSHVGALIGTAQAASTMAPKPRGVRTLSTANVGVIGGALILAACGFLLDKDRRIRSEWIGWAGHVDGTETREAGAAVGGGALVAAVAWASVLREAQRAAA
ncbi:MAG: hypothetical protein U0441_23405 [Polyangiaceae bacterium]